MKENEDKRPHNGSCCEEEPICMNGFSCPLVLPASVPDTRFCTTERCPDKIPTKRFSSPNSPLSRHELEKLKKFIEQINSILSTLSNPRNLENLSALRVYFRKLRGMIVKVGIDCGNATGCIEGLLKEAGRDFVEIEKVGNIQYVPFLRICEVQSNPSEDMEMGHMGQELIDIEPCLRRSIVLNFGETVANNPELINIFFGIPLFAELAKFIGCNIKVRTMGEAELIEGVLVDTKIDKICVKVNHEIEQINIEDIFKVTI